MKSVRKVTWLIPLAIFFVSAQMADASEFDNSDTTNPPRLPGQAFPDENVLDSQFRKSVRIPDLITYSYHRNPSIRSATEAWRMTVEQYRITTSYPDPQIMFTYFPEPIQTRLGPQDWNASISQMIPFPGKLFKAGEIVRTDAHIARLNLDKTVRDITVAILESFHELRYIREARRIADQNVKLLDQLRKMGETAYAQDRALFLDVVKAQSQSAQLRYDALLLEELEQTETTRLNGLLNREPDAGFGPLEKPPIRPLAHTLAEIYQIAEAGQEEIRMAHAVIEKTHAKMDMAMYQNLPDFKLGIFYASIGEPDVSSPPQDVGQDAFGLQFGVTLPLWSDKKEGRLLLAKAEVDKAKAVKAERIIKTRTSIRNIFFRLRNARRLISLYKDEMLPQAANAMEMAETWSREGEGSFSDFVETESVFYNFQLSLARATADYGKYLVRLEQLAGRSLTEKTEFPEENNRGKGEK